jgi:penicillin amidase
MQMDVTSTTARAFLPKLRGVVPADTLSKQALTLLDGWDGRVVMDAPQPLIFNAWMELFYRTLLRQDGVRTGTTAAAAPWPDLLKRALSPDNAALCDGKCGDLLTQTLTAATGDLAARFGPDPAAWRWGAAHRAVFGDPLLERLPVLGPLTSASIDSPGDDTTVDRAGLRPGGFDAVHGPSFRGVYDLADLDRSRFVVAPGQSGHIVSSLARNFVQRWRDGGTVVLTETPPDVAAHIHLTPAGSTP